MRHFCLILLVLVVTVSKLHSRQIPKSNLQAWFAADKGVKHQAGRASAWEDLSGNGRHANQQNWSNQPNYETDGLNGQPSLYFNSRQSLALEGASLAGKDYTIFVVQQREGSHFGNFFMVGGEVGRNKAIALGYEQPGLVRQAHFLNDLDLKIPNEKPWYANVMTFRLDQNQGRGAFVNGVSIGQGTRPEDREAITRLKEIGIGGSRSLRLYFKGKISEILIYDKAMTDAEIMSVNQTLVKKYRIDQPLPFKAVDANLLSSRPPADYKPELLLATVPKEEIKSKPAVVKVPAQKSEVPVSTPVQKVASKDQDLPEVAQARAKANQAIVAAQQALPAYKGPLKPPLVAGEVAGYQANDHVIEIHAGGRVAALVLDSSSYARYRSQQFFNSMEPILPEIARDVYQVFGDDFDYIAITYKEPATRRLPARHYPIRNDTRGIGKPVFDNSTRFHSNGRLQSILEVNSYLFFEGSVSHEVIHRWGVARFIPFEKFDLNFKSQPESGHWGITALDRYAQHNSFVQEELIEKGNNTYEVDFRKRPETQLFASMEQYLIGMIPLEEVPPFDVFTQLTGGERIERGVRFTANKKTTYTPEMLREILGERVPSYQESQKHFRMLTLVLTDEPLSEKIWSKVDERAYRNGYPGDNRYPGRNFWEGTGGRGTMQTDGLKAKTGAVKVY